MNDAKETRKALVKVIDEMGLAVFSATTLRRKLIGCHSVDTRLGTVLECLLAMVTEERVLPLFPKSHEERPETALFQVRIDYLEAKHNE